MPPAQCPECGRFLSKDFVTSLTDEPTPCPSCETPLMAADFGSSRKATPKADPVAEESPATPPAEAADPAADGADDPLAGWDSSGAGAWPSDTADEPSDAAVIGIAALIGALIGLLLGKPGRLSAMLFGAAVGAGAGAASRRVWELEG
ncbi:MAG: hypothetical protein R3249_02270 [Nitriliruptorales bacterium]|nr:hypothetical protein [Nitriliruptorales bacterium]